MKYLIKLINMKKHIILILSWLCVLLTMIMIFCFSAENAEKSTQTSAGVIEDVLDAVLPEDEVTPELVNKLQFPFRKMAHFGIFMLLGFCLSNAFNITIKNKWYITYPCAFVAGVIYAISDEWHQSFSLNRGPSPKDVLIDSTGVFIGIAVFVAFLFIFNHFKNKKPIK